MKTRLNILAMAAAMFAAGGCAADNVSTEHATAESAKILVAYYSYSGNTRFAAEEIQKATGGTLFEIVPVKAYSTDYNECVAEAKKEIRAGVKPELKSVTPDLSKYDVIFVGTPNWWSTMAPPVRTFLSSSNFAGKTVIPFVTHGGGGMANCERDMHKALPNAKFAKGGAFSGSRVRSSGDAIRSWLKDVITIKK